MLKMKKYTSFFRMRFIAGLQYRAAALAGISTQFAWGGLAILAYKTFYETNSAAFPMSFQALATYVWLQQAFLALFTIWIFENEIFQTIKDGGIAYELCRPVDIYTMWFFRSMANRLSKAVIRCIPILIFAGFLPAPYGIGLPVDLPAFMAFLVTSILGFLVVIAFCMLIYIITFFTYSAIGVRMVAVSITEILSGAIIPLPFLPDKLRRIVELLPFASMQNVPLRAYSGDISGTDLFLKAGLQLFWAVFMIWIGRRIVALAGRRIIVQGG